MRVKISSVNQLIGMVDEQMRQLLKSNLQELHLAKQQIQTLQRQKQELKQMLYRCGIGDLAAKTYVKQTIREILTEKLQISEQEMEEILPIHHLQRMSGQDMFEVMLCCYKRSYGKGALTYWITEHQFDKCWSSGKEVFEINLEQVRNAYERGYHISHMEWLELIVQRVYADYRGLGVVDEIRDLHVDGVSGGVSEGGEEERSVWIMYQGKSVYLSFLCFGSKENLQRICRTIYRHGQPGQLSRKRGYVVNEMADHARVVVARPDFCENWVFFVRKLDNLQNIELEHLFCEEQSDLAVLLLTVIVSGCQTIAITGAQGSGKTTLLMALIEHIAPNYTLRIQESAFELQLRRRYPKRNIVSFRETESISGQEGLDFQKKTDGTVSIVGEVASAAQAVLMLQLGQMASLFTLFTHHANSTRNLIWALQNNLLQVGQFSDEKAARQQVVECVRFHVHLVKNAQGRRYIDYITEIVPRDIYKENSCGFEERRLLCWNRGRYEWLQPISEETFRNMSIYMEEEERQAYEQQMLSDTAKDSGDTDTASPVQAAHASVLSVR